jgi:hypothetical protein
VCFGQRQMLEQQRRDAARMERELKEQEARRQANIRDGRTRIESAFSRFNDGYFGDFVNDFLSHYFPQIDEQYDSATGTARASYRDRGIGQSTVAARGMANLFTERGRARTQVANDAQGAANNLRGQVENTKTNLYNLNQSAADPEAANIRAQAEASALVAPPNYSPLGQVFASAMQPIVNAGQAYRNRAPTPYVSPYAGATGGGSATVVR